jgi:hypothetical protein
MARVSNFLSLFFFSLGTVLVTLAVLAVPENAFADAGSDCAASCASDWTPGTPDYYTCLEGCCGKGCTPGNLVGCQVACCDSACSGASNYSECLAACSADVCDVANCAVSCDVKNCIASGNNCIGSCDNSGGTKVCIACCPCHNTEPLATMPQCECIQY